jgi:hypothetical protein
MIHPRNEHGFEGPKRVDKKVDVPSTVRALSHPSSTSINASIEEVQLQCQSATSQNWTTTSTFSLGEGTPMYPGKYPYPLKSFLFINKKSEHMKVHTYICLLYRVEYLCYFIIVCAS